MYDDETGCCHIAIQPRPPPPPPYVKNKRNDSPHRSRLNGRGKNV